MEFTWKNIFDLVNKMWGLNQSRIASYLEVNESTISKLKTGNQFKFERPYNELYKKLFDPTNPKIPAYGNNPKALLWELKENIKEAGWADITKGLNIEDYEKFVIGLFRLANENQSKQGAGKQNEPHNIAESKNNNQKVNEIQPERMLDVCRECFEGYSIDKFIDSDPADFIKSYIFKDMFKVVGFIQCKHKNEDSPDKHSDVYLNIIKFADDLLAYIEFLKTDDRKITVEGYEPLKGDNNKFLEEANRYRQQLKTLYKIINAEIEKDEKEYLQQRQATYKEVWDKNMKELF